MSGGREVKKGQKRERLLPYAYAKRGLRCDLMDASIDGDRQLGSIDRKAHLIRLETRDWEELSLKFRLAAEDDMLQRVLPDGSDSGPPADYLLAVRCPDTHYRYGVRVGLDLGADDFAATIKLTIERDHVRGSIAIIPFLIRNVDADDQKMSMAVTAGARVASTRSWEVRVDSRPRARTQHLDINFVAFSEHNRFEAYADRVYFLDADGEKPMLWLNQDHPRVAQILGAKGTVGIAARTRDVFFDLIANPVWTQLFVRAAASLDEHGETTFEWQAGVLHEIAPEIYPEYDAETRLDIIRAHVGDPAQLGELIQHVDLVLQAKDGYARHMTSLVDEALKE
jgi:hypothetical protein